MLLMRQAGAYVESVHHGPFEGEVLQVQRERPYICELSEVAGCFNSLWTQGANSQESNPGASKGSSFQKGKGKGRGGKKGKLFAVFDEETGAWWYTDYDEDFEESAPQEGQAESTEQAQTLVLSCVLETY